MTVTTPSFPILTFDVNKLTPSFGYVFDGRWLDPYESVVSILWKFVWMNRLAGHEVVERIARHTVDPYAGMQATLQDINAKYLARTLRIRCQTVREAIPLQTSLRSFSPELRYCSRCMARGYHSVLHQFGRLSECPIHARPLESRCRHCGKGSAYRIDAQMLDAPFKCPHCRVPYSPSWSRFAKRSALGKHERMVLIRAYIG